MGQAMGLGPRELAWLYFWHGETLICRGRGAEMTGPAEEMLARLGEQAESVEAALMNEIAGMAYRWSGKREKAQEYIRRNARFLQRLSYSEELRSSYYSILRMYSAEEDNIAEATKWAQVFEEKARQYHDLRALGGVLQSRAGFLQERGDLQGTIALLEQALEPYSKIGGVREQYLCYMRLRESSLLLGKLGEAEAYANKQRAAAEAMGDQREIVVALVAIAKIAVCQGRWDQAAAAFEKAAQVNRGDNRTLAWVVYARARASLFQGKRLEARKQFQEAASLHRPDPLALVDLLGGLEQAYDDHEAFLVFCQRFRAEHPAADASPFVQWYLEPAEPDCRLRIVDCGLPTGAAAIHNPQSAIRNGPWVWHDLFGDCSFTVRNGLEIRAANGRDLCHPNRSAPRLLRPISGDFAIQAVCRSVSEAVPAMGGLLLWRNKQHYLRLDWGARGPHQLSVGGCLPGKESADQVRWGHKEAIIGRGRLVTERIFLRLERRGGSVRALCSADGQRWFTVGQVEFPAAEPVEVGLHAIGLIDRINYPGAYPEGTAIRFESFEL